MDQLTVLLLGSNNVSGLAHSEQHEVDYLAENQTASNVTGRELNGTATTVLPLLYLRTRMGLVVILTLVLVVSTIVGALGNLLVILTIALVQNLRSCGNMFILNLALADLVITAVVDPFNAVGALAGETAYYGNNMLCNVIGSVCAPACMSSMWNMCVISLNRYVLICHPGRYHVIFSKLNTFLICLMIWVGCNIAHLPNHLGWGKIAFNEDFYLCTFDVTKTPSYAIFYVFMGVLIPLVGVLFGYAGIFQRVRNARIRMRQHKQQRAVRKDDQIKPEGIVKPDEFTRDDIRLAKTLFMAFMVFFICWLPFALLVLTVEPAGTPKWIYVVAMILAHGNSAMNPILYGMSNEKFRDGYWRLIGCRLRASRSVGNSLVVTNPSRNWASGNGDSIGRKRASTVNIPLAISSKEGSLTDK